MIDTQHERDPQKLTPTPPGAPDPVPHPHGVETTVVAPTGWRSWSRDMLVSIAISLFIILFLYQPVRVEGTSMLPRLQDQDRLFINKFA